MKRVVFSIVFCACFYSAIITCCGAAGFSSGRPSLSIESMMRTDVSADVISVKYVDSTDTAVITLNNWGIVGNVPDFKYSGGNLLKLGTKVGLYFGAVKLSEGVITSLSPTLPEGGQPVLTFVVTGNSQLKGGQIQSRFKKPRTLTLSYGNNLFELSETRKMVDPVIECTGKAAGSPDLRIGTVLTITGGGQDFSGEYSVSETIHLFDQSKGNITEFTATKN